MASGYRHGFDETRDGLVFAAAYKANNVKLMRQLLSTMNGDDIIRYRPYLLRVLIDLDLSEDFRYDMKNYDNYKAYVAAIGSEGLKPEVSPMDLNASMEYAERNGKLNALAALRRYQNEITQGTWRHEPQAAIPYGKIYGW